MLAPMQVGEHMWLVMSQAWFVGQSPAAMQPQEPLTQALSLDLIAQSTQLPPLPQLVPSVAPPTHMFKLAPVTPQQPVLQRDPALQLVVHVLPVHAWPGEQSLATLQAMHAPEEEQIGVMTPHGVHAPPLCPQALVPSPGWHVPPPQHPW